MNPGLGVGLHGTVEEDVRDHGVGLVPEEDDDTTVESSHRIGGGRKEHGRGVTQKDIASLGLGDKGHEGGHGIRETHQESLPIRGVCGSVVLGQHVGVIRKRSRVSSSAAEKLGESFVGHVVQQS
jgi:hypothetical protein